MKSKFLDKLIERLDRLDPQSLQTQFLRLTREKGLLEAVFNALQEGVVVLDGRGRINYANNAAGMLLGFSPESAGGQQIGRFLRDIKWNEIVNLDEREWSKLINREIEIKYPERKFLSFYVMPISMEGSREKGAVLILRDVTMDREREQDVLKSERMNALTLLAAGVAHEIGNPLNSLHIHLQLMNRELQNLGERERRSIEDLVRVAGNEVSRLNLIITQFLRAIRPSAPDMESTRIEEVLNETLQFMKHDIENRDVLVEAQCPEPVPNVSVDRNKIKQAFFNIIKNALQAMSKGGLLTITIFSDDRSVGISFSDTGPGIDAEGLRKLFEPYGTTKPDGSGLGLMIVQRIVHDHGGEIEVQSRPGAGTTITMLLPLDQRRIRLLKAHRKSARGQAPKEKGDGGTDTENDDQETRE